MTSSLRARKGPDITFVRDSDEYVVNCRKCACSIEGRIITLRDFLDPFSDKMIEVATLTGQNLPLEYNEMTPLKQIRGDLSFPAENPSNDSQNQTTYRNPRSDRGVKER